MGNRTTRTNSKEKGLMIIMMTSPVNELLEDRLGLEALFSFRESARATTTEAERGVLWSNEGCAGLSCQCLSAVKV